MNINEILDSWEFYTKQYSAVYNSEECFKHVNIKSRTGNPWLGFFDWWPKNQVDYNLRKFENKAHNHYLLETPKGSLRTVEILWENRQNKTLWALSWIQAFVNNKLSPIDPEWYGDTLRLLKEFQTVFYQNREYLVEWHSAMKYQLPCSYSDFYVLGSGVRPSTFKEIIQLSVVDMIMCLGRYQMIVYDEIPKT